MMLKAAYEDELKNFLSTPKELASDYFETFKAALLGRYRKEHILDIIDEENDDKECLLQCKHCKKYLEKAEVDVFLQQLLTLAAETWEEESREMLMMLKAAYEDELKNFLSTPEELASDYYETFKAALLGRYREEQDILDIIWQA
eukprot:5558275-Amphidinium_carterae.1